MTHSTEQTAGRGDKDQAIEEMLGLFSKIAAQFEANDDDEGQWMIEHSPAPAVMRETLHDMTVMGLHVLDAIGRLEPVNGITISKQFNIPKGSVSKATRRLIAKKLIQTEALPNNKKEVLFRLTPLGRQLFEVHRALHQEMDQVFVGILQKYDTDKLWFAVEMMQDFIQTPRLKLEQSQQTALSSEDSEAS